MKYVYCDKCGCEISETVFISKRTATITLNSIEENNFEIHPCENCTEELKAWIRGQVLTSDYSSEIPF